MKASIVHKDKASFTILITVTLNLAIDGEYQLVEVSKTFTRSIEELPIFEKVISRLATQ